MSSTFLLNNALNQFIQSCDNSINQLYSARSTEWLDAGSSNNSLFGFCVSMSSNSQNYSAASAVDNLQHQAFEINRMIDLSSLRGRVMLLDTSFNGSGIRNAEDSEHSLLGNIFFGSFYSSCASINTADELSRTAEKVRWVRDQAWHIKNMLNRP